jgi:hypothetical protein
LKKKIYISKEERDFSLIAILSVWCCLCLIKHHWGGIGNVL